MFGWALRRDLLATTPCAGVEKLVREVPRSVTYSDEQLRAIVAVAADTDLEDLVALLMRTATRSHETRSIRWVDLSTTTAVSG